MFEDELKEIYTRIVDMAPVCPDCQIRMDLKNAYFAPGYISRVYSCPNCKSGYNKVQN